MLFSKKNRTFEKFGGSGKFRKTKIENHDKKAMFFQQAEKWDILKILHHLHNNDNTNDNNDDMINNNDNNKHINHIIII